MSDRKPPRTKSYIRKLPPFPDAEMVEIAPHEFVNREIVELPRRRRGLSGRALRATPKKIYPRASEKRTSVQISKWEGEPPGEWRECGCPGAFSRSLTWAIYDWFKATEELPEVGGFGGTYGPKSLPQSNGPPLDSDLAAARWYWPIPDRPSVVSGFALRVP